MPDTIQLEAVVEHLRLGISLLERLHVLSQTETLILETANPVALATVVEAKEVLVDKIRQMQVQLTAMVQAEPGCLHLPALKLFKERALDLIERISSVEGRNSKHLEAYKAETIRRSHALQEERKLLQAYGQPA